MRFVFVFLFGCMLSLSVSAQEIVAVVNDVPISEYDVISRVRFMQFQQKKSDQNVSYAERKEALANLVDEEIKRQEADRLNLVPQKEEIERAVQHLEKQNGLNPGDFKKLLGQKKIPFSTMWNQVAADLAWMRVVAQKGHRASVSETEVLAREKMMKQALKKESLHFAEIVVPSEKKATELWGKIKAGSDFKTLAQTESIAMSRAVGGEVINQTSLYYGKSGEAILKAMQPGQLSRPIRVPNGYALVLMLNRRDPVLSESISIMELSQAVVPAGSVAEQILAQPVVQGCDAFKETVKEDALPGSFQQGNVMAEKLPPEVQKVLQGQDFQKVIGPISTPAGLLYFMKCGERKERLIPDRETLKKQIEMEKMDLESKQKLEELKRSVVIEYKE